jgi:multidrug efflux pump subunit AcrB
MAVGVAVANSILYISNAEHHRKQGVNPDYAVVGAHDRLRPILMTSFAMTAGMIPMAIGLGQGSDQTAPLGIAVIGGLVFSMLSTLIFLPMIFGSVMNKKPYKNPSLDPEDPGSKYYKAVQ